MHESKQILKDVSGIKSFKKYKSNENNESKKSNELFCFEIDHFDT